MILITYNKIEKNINNNLCNINSDNNLNYNDSK